MKLDRTNSAAGHGKYGLIQTRRLAEIEAADKAAAADVQSNDRKVRHTADRSAINLAIDVAQAISTLERAGVIDWGLSGTPSEFFVVRLRDINASTALASYAQSASRNGDSEFAREVMALSAKAENSKYKKKPD